MRTRLKQQGKTLRRKKGGKSERSAQADGAVAISSAASAMVAVAAAVRISHVAPHHAQLAPTAAAAAAAAPAPAPAPAIDPAAAAAPATDPDLDPGPDTAPAALDPTAPSASSAMLAATAAAMLVRAQQAGSAHEQEARAALGGTAAATGSTGFSGLDVGVGGTAAGAEQTVEALPHVSLSLSVSGANVHLTLQVEDGHEDGQEDGHEDGHEAGEVMDPSRPPSSGVNAQITASTRRKEATPFISYATTPPAPGVAPFLSHEPSLQALVATDGTSRNTAPHSGTKFRHAIRAVVAAFALGGSSAALGAHGGDEPAALAEALVTDPVDPSDRSTPTIERDALAPLGALDSLLAEDPIAPSDRDVR